MSTLFTKRLYENRAGLWFFSLLSLLTAAVLANTQKTATPPQTANQLKISSQLSQTKLIKNDVNTVYLDVSIQSPGINMPQSTQRASDIIVILDRSGSMSAANKMPYAKAAIHDLLSRLNNHDRFALISFANNAIVHSPLTTVNSQHRAHLADLINNIRPGGGTNIGAGLSSAAQLLSDKQANRASKVLLLSDGQANQGITDLNGLSQLLARLTQQESVLSSIGMGLDFNETLMSSLADYGMGSYAYLENLSGLGDIFNSQLNATRNIFAANSHINISLTKGIELVDAGGYPISKAGNNSFNIKTGQLLGHSDKKFVMTFKVTPQATGHLSIGTMSLNYQVQGKRLAQDFSAQALTLAVVKPEQKQEAIASINQDVYKQSVLKNNLGRMQKQLSHWLRKGDKDKADKVINSYRDELSKAEQKAAMPLASAEMDNKLNEMESSVDDAFSGSYMDQQSKRKRAAKNIQMESLKEQRSMQAN